MRNLVKWSAAISLAAVLWLPVPAVRAQSVQGWDGQDTDRDGRSDTWIRRGPGGAVTAIAKDRRHDGQPDTWQYFKAGTIYKREYDRNFDGQADFRIFEEDGRFVAKEYDLDFDGTFEHHEKAPAKGASGIAKTTAGP